MMKPKYSIFQFTLFLQTIFLQFHSRSSFLEMCHICCCIRFFATTFVTVFQWLQPYRGKNLKCIKNILKCSDSPKSTQSTSHKMESNTAKNIRWLFEWLRRGVRMCHMPLVDTDNFPTESFYESFFVEFKLTKKTANWMTWKSSGISKSENGSAFLKLWKFQFPWKRLQCENGKCKTEGLSLLIQFS